MVERPSYHSPRHIVTGELVIEGMSVAFVVVAPRRESVASDDESPRETAEDERPWASASAAERALADVEATLVSGATVHFSIQDADVEAEILQVTNSEFRVWSSEFGVRKSTFDRLQTQTRVASLRNGASNTLDGSRSPHSRTPSKRVPPLPHPSSRRRAPRSARNSQDRAPRRRR